MNRPEPQLSKVALDRLGSYDWPGNVRELQNTVERAIISWLEGPLTFDLPASWPHESTGEQAKSVAKAAFSNGMTWISPRKTPARNWPR